MAKAANQLIVAEQPGRINRPVAASKHLYEGCLSFIDSSGNATDTTNSGANKLGGMNVKEVDNSNGIAGAANIELRRDVVQVEGTGFTSADVDKPCYFSDNFTATLTAAGNVYGGPIVKVISSTKVMVDLSKGAAEAGDLDVTLQTITLVGATGVNVVNITDNLASALHIKQGANTYLKFISTDGSEQVLVGQNLGIADGKNVVLDTTTGTKFGTDAAQKLGFWNATPIVQPASANQDALTDSTGGSVSNATLAAVGATNSGDVSAAINGNFAKTAELVNAMRTALVNVGIIKGAA